MRHYTIVFSFYHRSIHSALFPKPFHDTSNCPFWNFSAKEACTWLEIFRWGWWMAKYSDASSFFITRFMLASIAGSRLACNKTLGVTGGNVELD